MIYRAPLVLAVVGLACSAALPAMSQVPGDVVQAQLLPGWQMEQGRQMAGLHLDLAPGWKTYWRAPGDAGIPPMFDWSGSQNLASARIHWPAPTVFHTNGLQSIGYQSSVTLPIEVVAKDPSAPVTVQLQVDLGVCKDVCVPASVSLEARLPPGAGAPDASIGAALKARPSTGRQAGLGNIACDLEPISDGLRLTARMSLPRQGADETVVFEPGLQGVWASQSVTTRSGGDLVSVVELVPPDGQPFALDRSGITVTVISNGGAVEIAGCPAP